MFEILDARRRYHQERLLRAERDYHSLKAALLGAGVFRWDEREYGPPQPNELAAEMYLKGIVDREQKFVEELDQQMEGLCEGEQTIAEPEHVETEHGFMRRHGGEKVKIAYGVWVFADGAQIRNHGYGPLFAEPPSDPKACLELRKQFFQIKLRTAESAFERLKGALTGHLPTYFWNEEEFGSNPPPDGKDALLRLKGFVTRYREGLNEIERDWELLPEVVEMRQREERSAAMREAARLAESEERAQIQAIKL